MNDSIRKKTFLDILVYPDIELLKSPSGGSEHKAGPAYPDFEHETFCRHNRANGVVDDNPATEGDMGVYKTALNLKGSYIWGGCIINHFGHFVSEFSHRFLRASLDNPSAKILYSSKSGSEIPRFIQQIFEHFNVSERIVLVEKPVVVEELIVYEQEAVLGSGKASNEDYLEIQNTFKSRALSKGSSSAGKIIFVSRSKQRACFIGEGALDEFFSEVGVSVFYPENKSLAEQLETYCLAQHIIFSEGSAMHGVELAGTISAKVSVLTRRAGEFGRGFLQQRAKYLEYIRADGDAIGLYLNNGRPADWSATTFFCKPNLYAFLRALELREIGAGAVEKAIESLDLKLAHLSANALMGFLNHAKTVIGLRCFPGRVVRDVFAINDITAEEKARCVTDHLEIEFEDQPQIGVASVDLSEYPYETRNLSPTIRLALRFMEGAADVPRHLKGFNDIIFGMTSEFGYVSLLYQLLLGKRIRLSLSGFECYADGTYQDHSAAVEIMFRSVFARLIGSGFSYAVIESEKSLDIVKMISGTRRREQIVVGLLMCDMPAGSTHWSELKGFVLDLIDWFESDTSRQVKSDERSQEVLEYLSRTIFEWDGKDELFLRMFNLIEYQTDDRARIHLLRSQILDRQGSKIRALLHGMMALNLDQSSSCVAHMAHCLAEIGNHKAALVAWQRACSLDPNNVYWIRAMKSTEERVAILHLPTTHRV